MNSLDEEQQRAAKEGLSEDELALFDLLQKDGLNKSARERVKQASKAHAWYTLTLPPSASGHRAATSVQEPSYLNDSLTFVR